MRVTDFEVQAFGLAREHKVKAVLSGGVWCTYYVNAGVVSLHDPEKGGLGRFLEEDFKHPEVLKVLIEAYRLRAKIKNTHIGHVQRGDIVLFDGLIKTVTADAIGGDIFTGLTLWGDSYQIGLKPVKLLMINGA